MLEIRRVVFACALAGAAACSAGDKAPVDDQFGGPVVGGKADHNSIGLAGTLAFGATSAATYHDYPPRYLAFAFRAGGGDTIDVRVQSLTGGDPVTWILNAQGQVIGANDDESQQSLNSRVQMAMPSGPAATHYIVFRDYDDAPGTFRVTLGGEQDWLSCQKDSDCARVEAGCCAVGDYVAVRADRAVDHAASLGCTGSEVCPPPPAGDHGETAVCDNNSGTCEILLPDEIQCGGFSTNPHACPPGYECVGDALAYDGTGECAKLCGGFGNLPCPAGQTCEDNPHDDCDPQAGGADCAGICLGD